MINRFEHVLRTKKLVLDGEKIIVGVSGGADSMAMLDLFVRCRNKFELELFVVHINHCLRGVEADADARLVQTYCDERGIPFFLEQIDVSVEAKRRKKSFEETGREVRYESFRKYCNQVHADKIAVAHNENDQAETMLMRFMRGSGIDGLGGMNICTEGYLIRPMMVFSRDEIEKYCHDEKINFSVDYTNADNKYTRNRVRNVLMPMIKQQFNPNIIRALATKSSVFQMDADYINMAFEKLYTQANITKDNYVYSTSLTWFHQLHPSMQSRFIRKTIQEFGNGLRNVSSAVVFEIMDEAIKNNHGCKKVVAGLEFEISYDRLYWKSVDDENYAQSCVENYSEKIDANKISGGIESLHVRFRRAGDRFNPLGMKGEKKLKDFFIDAKIPKHRRDEIPLVCDDSGIIWVVGYRIANRVKCEYGDHQSSENTILLQWKDDKLTIQ